MFVCVCMYYVFILFYEYAVCGRLLLYFSLKINHPDPSDIVLIFFSISETIVDASNSSGTSATGTNGSAERKNTTPGELKPSKLSRPPPGPSSPHPDINKTDTSPKRGGAAEATGTAVAASERIMVPFLGWC